MISFIESNAGRIAARIQAFGGGFDPEILSLPGGSFIAAYLWLHAGAVVTLKRWAARRQRALASVAAPLCPGCCGHR
ncbi:MAG: hypothetical protein M3O26_11715 [Pseudomonadota bacterium]|nr:hypothetical protein [Pseudomonadota bacterium]